MRASFIRVVSDVVTATLKNEYLSRNMYAREHQNRKHHRVLLSFFLIFFVPHMGFPFILWLGIFLMVFFFVVVACHSYIRCDNDIDGRIVDHR